MAYTQTAAMARALSHNGKGYPEGWCQAFVCVEVFATGGVGDYDGDRAADAEDGWKKAKAVGKVVPVPTNLSASALAEWMKNIPGGLPMYWTGGSRDNGHAATSLPNGKLFTTDKTPGVCGIVDNTWPHTHWGLTFVGYVTTEGNGHNLLDKPIAATPESVVYKVTAKALNGRSGPGTNYPVVKTVDQGAKITSTGFAKAADGSTWVINTEKLWWAKSYLEIPAVVPNIVTPDNTVYVVTASPSLRGRSGPGTTFATVDAPITGSKITAKNDHQTPDGDVWVENIEGRFYSKAYLKPAPTKVLVKTDGQNLAGYNAPDRPGVTGFKTHIPNIIGAVINDNPDIFLTNELSNKDICKMRPLVDSGLKNRMTRAAGGTDGRYAYVDNDIKIIASGNFVAAKSTWYNNDDKQCAWVVFEKDGKRGMDCVYQLAYQNGGVPDKKRVEQALDFDTQIFNKAKAMNVPVANVLIIPDTNSEGMVINALVKDRKRVNGAAGTSFEKTNTFNKWTSTSISRIDYFVLGAGAKVVSVKVVKSKDSDHDRLIIVRELV